MPGVSGAQTETRELNCYETRLKRNDFAFPYLMPDTKNPYYLFSSKKIKHPIRVDEKFYKALGRPQEGQGISTEEWNSVVDEFEKSKSK